MRCTQEGRLAQCASLFWLAESVATASSGQRCTLISVCEMSTDRNRLQCSHAAGPIQLKSAGKNNVTFVASGS